MSLSAYLPEEEQDDQEGYEFELESFQISSGGGVNALDNSLKLLEESLESNAAIAQFEVSTSWVLFFVFNIRLHFIIKKLQRILDVTTFGMKNKWYTSHWHGSGTYQRVKNHQKENFSISSILINC